MVEQVEGSALPVSGGILAMIPEVDLGIEYARWTHWRGRGGARRLIAGWHAASRAAVGGGSGTS